MAEVEELGNDNIQENSCEETNSTNVVRILGFSKYLVGLAHNENGRTYSTMKLLSLNIPDCYHCFKHLDAGKYRGMGKVEIVEIYTKKTTRR
jgi:hypothetical protein